MHQAFQHRIIVLLDCCYALEKGRANDVTVHHPPFWRKRRWASVAARPSRAIVQYGRAWLIPADMSRTIVCSCLCTIAKPSLATIFHMAVPSWSHPRQAGPSYDTIIIDCPHRMTVLSSLLTSLYDNDTRSLQNNDPMRWQVDKNTRRQDEETMRWDDETTIQRAVTKTYNNQLRRSCVGEFNWKTSS